MSKLIICYFLAVFIVFSDHVSTLRLFPHAIRQYSKSSNPELYSSSNSLSNIIPSTYLPSISAVQYVDYSTSQPLSIATTSDDLYTVTNSPLLEKQPVLSNFLSWIVRRLVQGRTEFVSGLNVKVKSSSNFAILRGNVSGVDISFDKVCFNQLYCSGGGRLTIKGNHSIDNNLFNIFLHGDDITGLELRMRRFLFRNKEPLRKSYEVYGDLLLTQAGKLDS
jgi:hypothetical protein